MTFTVEVPGGRIVGEESGTGPAVVLLHAGVADRRMWRHLVPGLAPRHRVIRFDTRGYGESPMSTAPFQLADDVVAVLDQLGVERAHLVGASMGGMVALDAALEHPDRVASLTLLASALFGHEVGAEIRDYWAAEEAALGRGDIETVIELNLEIWVRGMNREWTPHLRAVADELRDQLRIITENQARGEDLAEAAEPPARDRLEQVAAPTLVVVAENDPPGLVAIGEHIATRVPGARLARLADTAHLPALERPVETLALLTEHLN